MRARSRWMKRALDVRSGQAIVWVAVMLPLFLSVIGLAIDGGIVFDARRELQNVADGAARAGAMQIDQRTYRSSGGATVVLDANGARQVAAAYVASQGEGLATTITATPRGIRVTVQKAVPTSFLCLVGIDAVEVTASATAGVAHGITQGSTS